MQVYKANRKIFWTNELKSWFLTFAFAVALYYCVKLFSSVSAENLMVGFAVILLLKIADVVTPYRVTEIGIDAQKDQMKFKLYSLLSGDKVKTYELRQVSSELVHYSGLAKLLSSPLTLKVFLTSSDMFRISSRYGFSAKTLASVDNTLKALSTSNATP